MEYEFLLRARMLYDQRMIEYREKTKEIKEQVMENYNEESKNYNKLLEDYNSYKCPECNGYDYVLESGSSCGSWLVDCSNCFYRRLSKPPQKE